MKVHVVEQGSPAWHALRLGIPTASAFDRIITPAKGLLSSGARRYAIELVAERLMGAPVIDLGNVHSVQRGKELEPEAARMYEFELDAKVSPVGFVTTDDGRIGASPDLLVDGQPGAVELKCPAPHTHVGYMLDGFGNDYHVQVQGQMLVGGFEWVDRYSYHPELPPVRVRTFRDDAFIAKLETALAGFLELRDALLAQAVAAGAVLREPVLPKPPPTRMGNYHTIHDPATQRAQEWEPA